MKKIMLMLGILMMSIGLYAETSCSIRGLSGEKITIKNENSQSGSNGQVCTWLTNSSSRTVQVMVYCYDAYTDQCVGVRSVNVTPAGANACFDSNNHDIKKNHPYYFRVTDAHCG